MMYMVQRFLCFPGHAILTRRYSLKMEKKKPKVVVKYNEIIDEEFQDEDVSWEEVFLLRANPEYLAEKIRQFSDEQLKAKRDVFLGMADRCVNHLLSETSIAFYNSCQTLYTVLESTIARLGLKAGVEFLFEAPEKSIAAILQRFYFFIVEPVHKDLKSTSVHFLERLVLLRVAHDEVPLLSFLIFSDAFDVLVAIWSQNNTLRLHGDASVRILAYMLSLMKTSDVQGDIFASKFVGLSDDLALEGLTSLILNQLEACNEHYANQYGNSRDGVISRISSLFISAPPVVECDVSNELNCLFVLFECVRLNKSFISHFLTTGGTIDDAEAEGERPSILRQFFTYFSLAFEDTKTELGLHRARLTLLITLLLTDDVFVQNSLHDPHNICSVPLFKPSMLHRPAVLDTKRAPCTLGTTALDMITELLVSHLKIGFPLEFYDLSLGIVHRILAYQKNRCVRMAHWLSLFNAMIALLRFLLANEGKCQPIFPLCYRLMVVINLFLTFGDTFLPSGEAYDFLYYELVRQEEVFQKLGDRAVRRLDQSKDGDWDYAQKVKNHLINPMHIINTVKSKLENIEEYLLTEEYIVNIIRISFESLSLKLYDGLTIVTPYDSDKQSHFFSALCRFLCEEALRNEAKDVGIAYPTLVQHLSVIGE